MSILTELWKYQQADLAFDKRESELRNTPTFRQLNKVRFFLEDQKKAVARLTEEVELYSKNVELAKEQYELAEKRYKVGIKKFETIDKEAVDEVVRFRKYFEQIHALVTNERKEFSAMEAALKNSEAQLDQMRKKIGPARKEYQELKAKYDEEREASKDEIDKLSAALAKAAKSVNSDAIAHYKRVKLSMAAPIAKVLSGQCGGCMMQLSAVLSRRLKESDEIIECENCGRILYLE